MRGPTIMECYFRNPAATKETIDERKWLHSGDIGTILPSGKLKIIDRKKNLFKLAQGEYIAPEKIEAFIELSPFITQCIVEGHSLKNVPVAIVIPDMLYLKQCGKPDDVKDPILVKFIQEEVDKYCKEYKLK